MLLPEGNVLFAKTNLSMNDLSVLRQNLSQNKFSGYILLDSYKRTDVSLKCIVLFLAGQEKKIIDITNKNHPKWITRAGDFYSRFAGGNIYTSVYVMSAAVVDVMSNIYLYNDTAERTVKKKEFKKIRDDISTDLLSGFLKFYIRGKETWLAMWKGKFVTDSLLPKYGNVLTDSTEVESFLKYAEAEGGRLTLSSERATNIDKKNRRYQNIAEAETEFKVKTLGGFAAKADELEIPKEVLENWKSKNITNPELINVEIITSSTAKLATYNERKCKAKGNDPSIIGIPKKLMEEWKLKDGDVVCVCPTNVVMS